MRRGGEGEARERGGMKGWGGAEVKVQTHVEVSEVFIVIQSIAYHKCIGNLKPNVCT